MALTRAQIQTAFQNSLGRAASQSDENSYFSVSQSGALTDAQIFSTISNSREADQIADPVIRFYQAAFGRVPDQAGLANAEAYVRAFSPTAATYQNLSNMFAQSQEFTNRFGTGTAVDAAYVQALYSTILGRSATSAEVDGYVSGAAGYTTRGGVLYAVSQSSEAISVSDAAVNGFQNNAAQGQAVYSGTLYTAANGQPNTPGSNVTNVSLTTGTDTLTGGAGSDVFTGTVAATNPTLTLGDSINGGAGNDTLRIISDQAAAIPSAVTTSVETYEITSTAAATLAVNNQSTGLSTVNFVGGAATTFGLTNVAATTAFGITNDGSQIAVTANGVTGTNDAVTLTLNGARNTASFTENGIETFNVATTGSSSTLAALASDTLKAVNVSGTSALTITGALAAAGGGAFTFNAAANSGGVNATFGAGATTATGGSGNDKFAFGANFDTTDTIVGGAGTDTLAIDGVNFTTAGANTTQFGLLNTKVTGVEVLELTGTTATTIDRSALTNTEITKILFNTGTTGGGAVSNDAITGLTAATTVAVGTGNTGTLGLTAAQGNQSVNLNVEGSSTAASAGTGVVTLTGAGTLNIASTGTFAGAENAVAGVTTTANGILNITGSKDINLGTITAGAAAAGDVGDTVNAGSFTGKLSLVGSAGNDIVNVGSGGSLIRGGTGSDSITLGSGTDRVVYSTALESSANAPASTLDTVTGFAAGTDKFIVGNGGTAALPTALLQGANFTAAGTGTLATDIGSALGSGGQGVAGANLAVGAAALVTITGQGAGSYLVYNNDTAGYAATDTVVKLAGLTGTLALTDFATA